MQGFRLILLNTNYPILFLFFWLKRNEAISPKNTVIAKKENTYWYPLIPGYSSKKKPIRGPANISGVYPINETTPTAVPVKISGILHSLRTAKYKALVAYSVK